MLDFNRTDYENIKNNDLKRMADYWLRQYLIKESNSNVYGHIRCPLKRKYFHHSKMQVAHFIDRAKMNTRYDLDNVHLISEQSNMWDAQIKEEGHKSKHHKEYEEWLRGRLTDKGFEKLLEKSEERIIFGKEDYIKVIKKFRDG